MRGVFDFRAYQTQTPSFSTAGNRSVQGQGEVEIGALVFRCPLTQRDIESGIEIDRVTFRKIAQFGVRVNCTACGHRHEFKVASGNIASSRLVQPRTEIAERGRVIIPKIRFGTSITSREAAHGDLF
jgi:hypothetical protein